MSVKIDIINKSIAACDRKIAKIRALMNATPASDIIAGRKEFQRILVEHKGDHETISRLLQPLAKREKQLFAMAKKQTNMSKDIDRLVTLELERGELQRELFYATKRAS